MISWLSTHSRNPLSPTMKKVYVSAYLGWICPVHRTVLWSFWPVRLSSVGSRSGKSMLGSTTVALSVVNWSKVPGALT